jgi:hypothetical protein
MKCNATGAKEEEKKKRRVEEGADKANDRGIKCWKGFANQHKIVKLL